MTDSGTVDIHSVAFARRLASLLAQRRRQRGTTLRKLARASGRAFTAHELRALEEGRAPIDAQRLSAVAQLYGADLELITRERLPLEVRPAGVLMTGGIAQSFTPGDETSLLTSYLRLVRQLRSAERAPAIELRRDDVEVLADHLGQPGESIVDRLGALMGATVAQRRAMAGLFVSGALVIGLAGGSVAAIGLGSGSGGGSDTTVPGRDAATTTVEVPDPSPVVDARGADVDDGAHAIPQIVLDGESHGAPRAVPALPAVPSVDGADATPPAIPPSVTAGNSGTTASPTTTQPSSGGGAIVTEDTAVSADGSVGVGAPVIPLASGAPIVIDDASVPEVIDDVPFESSTVAEGATNGDPDDSDGLGIGDAEGSGDAVDVAVAPPPVA